jgi:hypothetical protein
VNVRVTARNFSPSERTYAAYSNATRGKREKAAASADPSSPHEAPEDPSPASALVAAAGHPRLRPAPRARSQAARTGGRVGP